METQTVSLKQCINKVTGEQIVMNGNDFIYLHDKTKVSNEIISKALAVKLNKTKDIKKIEIYNIYLQESTKGISYNNVIYKGGDSSASAIYGAVTLAQSLEETETKIIALDDSANILTFDETILLSGLISKAWRTAFFRYKELKLQISNAATVEELDLISWEEV